MSEELLKKPIDVARYLKSLGFTGSQKVVYNHINKGKMRRARGGGWRPADVETYARHEWSSKWETDAQVSVGGKAMERAQLKLKEAQASSATTRALRDALNLEREKKRLLPVADLDRALIGAVGVLRGGLRRRINDRAADILHRFGGDATQLPSFIAALRRMVDESMNGFTRDQVYAVLLGGDDPDAGGQGEGGSGMDGMEDAA